MFVRSSLLATCVGLALGCATAAGESSTTADDLETVAPMTLDWAACWLRPEVDERRHDVVCSTRALPAEWFLPGIELSARLGDDGAYIPFAAAETVVGSLEDTQFPAKLVVNARMYGSLLSRDQEIDSPSTYLAESPFVVSAPFAYWPIALEAAEGGIESISYDYPVPSGPYRVFDYALGQPVASLRVADGISIGGHANRMKLLLPAPSAELALGVNRTAPLTIDAPGRYIFEGGALRPATDADVCGVDGAKICRYPDEPCAPSFVEEAGVCRVCGREGGRACPPESVCAEGLRPDLDTDICEPCGKEGLPACGAVWEDRTCEPGLRAVFGAHDVVCVR